MRNNFSILLLVLAVAPLGCTNHSSIIPAPMVGSSISNNMDATYMNPATETIVPVTDAQLAPFINGATFQNYCTTTGFAFDSSYIQVINANDSSGDMIYNLQKKGSADDAVWIYTASKSNTYTPCIAHRYKSGGYTNIDITAMLTNVLYTTATNMAQPKKDCNNMSFNQCMSCEEVIVQSDWRTLLLCGSCGLDCELICAAFCALACTRSTMYVPSGGGEELSQQSFDDIFHGWYTDYYYDTTTSILIAN